MQYFRWVLMGPSPYLSCVKHSLHIEVDIWWAHCLIMASSLKPLFFFLERDWVLHHSSDLIMFDR